MSVTVDVTKKQGSTMGTVIAKVGDQGNVVRDVYFYVRVLDGVSGELGPYPPDIVRRPSPGVYEKDLVLDPRFETVVRTVVIRDDGTTVAGAEQTFGARAPTAGGAGEVRVQDADTPATVAGTLAFQGAVVNVANGVATFDLDGHYAQLGHLHDDRYYTEPEADGRFHPLNGAVGDGQLSGNIPRFGTGGTWTGSATLTFAQGRSGWNGWNVPLVLSNPSHAAIHATGVNWMQGFHADGNVYWCDTTPATGGYRMLLHRSGKLAVSGVVHAQGGNFAGAGGAFCYLDNSYVSWYTSENAALGTRVGSLLVSGNYSDSANAPPYGIYTPNVARLGTVQGTAATQTAYDTLFLGSSAGVNFFLDRNVAGGQIIVGYNTPKSTAGQQATFQIYNNATNRQVLFTAHGAGATGGENIVSLPLGALIGPYIRVGTSQDGYNASIRRTDGGDISLQAGVTGRVNIGDPPSTVGHKLNVNGDVYVQGGWIRTNGSTGWYNQSYGIGIYAQDSTCVRTYGTQYFRTGWFSCDAGGGLYSPDYGTHIIAESGSCFRVNTANGLRFTDTAGTQKGYVYHDGSSFGLLHGGGRWAVRAWNGGTMLYGDVQVEAYLNLTDGNGSHLGTGKRIYFGASPSDAYAIFKSGSWPSSGGGYSRLVINYHTGIVLGAQQMYGGIQFFGTELGAGGAKLFSIGENDEHVRVTNHLYASAYFNSHGHRMAASLSGQGSPTMAASEGTLYIQY